jgi:serine/threonine-protein kinase
MGEVYLAEDPELERTVALKVLHPGSPQEAGARARLLEEARAASALNHPGICTIYGIGESEGHAYIVMEHVGGRPLSEILREGPLPVESVLHYGVQIADALAHAHKQGVVHRDLKAANVMITPDGRAKVLDFGLAQRSVGGRADLTIGSMVTLESASRIAGTVWYMAPEVLKGDAADERSDIWALGILLYEAAAGELPFAGGTPFEVSAQILNESPRPLPPGLSPALRATVFHCLAKDPAQRYQSASEVRAALEALSSQAEVPIAPRRRRGPWRLVSAVAAAVVLVGALAAILVPRARRAAGPAGAGEARWLAVLPLENRSGEIGQEYLVEGMTDALVAELANLEGVRVIARDSVVRLRAERASREEIGERLGVGALVTGTFLRVGERVRITVELVDSATGAYLWAESFDGELDDILGLQATVARALAGEIRGAPTAETTAAAGGTDNPRAYEAYLRGRYHWNRRTAEDFERAIAYFEQAIEEDPAYALAWAGLADAHALVGVFGYASPTLALPAAREAARQALALDPGLAEAHATLGAVKDSFEWDWAGAEEEYRRAIALNPSYATAAHWYGMYLVMMGRMEEGLGELDRALELDPLSSPIRTSVAMALVYARRPQEALEHCERVLELDPDFAWAHNVLGQAYLQQGRFDAGVEHAGHAADLSSASPEYRAELAAAYAAAGRRSEALATLAEVERKREDGETPWFEMAMAHGALGDADRAFASLERAYDSRSTWMPYLQVEPRLDPLRSDPRFADLVRRMGFPTGGDRRP